MRRVKLGIGAIMGVLLALSGCSKLEEGSQKLNPVVVGFHPDGWIDPASPSFHGRAIAANNYSMSDCQSCHGTDFKGGSTTVSCYTCHSRGPEACNVCHGSALSIAPPKDLEGDTLTSAVGVGAHQSHLRTSTISAAFRCSTCHQTPHGFNEPLHIRIPLQGAPVVFVDSLAYTISDNKIFPQPVFNATTASCSGTYCHGTFDGGNQNNSPIWNATDQAKCGTCHGNPTTGIPTPLYNHPQGSLIDQNCGGCHYTVDSTGTRHPVAERLPDGSYQIDIPAVHVNGYVNLVGGQVPIDAKITGE